MIRAAYNQTGPRHIPTAAPFLRAEAAERLL
jgi:hypothetical protein